MLYFVYQYLQGIAHTVFTSLNMSVHSLKFMLDSSADLSEGLETLSLPPVVKASFGLIFSLALIDKLRGRL